MTIYSIKERPERIGQAAQWFHSKWGVPLSAYLESMQDSLDGKPVPQWYILTDEKDAILAGLGVIENDFHKRPDLTPNVCAVYVEEPVRMQGIARKLLGHACTELAKAGIPDAYLITTHTEFYEHCGWEFYTMVEEEEGDMVRMYHKHTKL